LDYGESIGDNWKNQMLANIVKLRFVDMPVFVDVGSIVAGYSLETLVSGRVGFSDSFTAGDTQGLSATGRYTDRPTITYMPKTGDDYLRSLLAPVEPKNLLALIQAGYNAELLFTWSVESINGVQNYSGTTKARSEADPEFYELAQLLRELQGHGIAAWEFVKDPETGHDIMLVLRGDGLEPGLQTKRQRVAEILGIDPSLGKYRVLYAPIRVSSDTLAIQTRSILQTLGSMARFVEIPAKFTAETAPGFDLSAIRHRPFRVLSSEDKPDASFAAIKYRDDWYWIENTDLASKRVFTLMLFMTTLTSRGDDKVGPVLTIPTG
ncbi:MAG: hypothetical protein ACYTHJ_22640, partial [Planctomycetota bacterium]